MKKTGKVLALIMTLTTHLFAAQPVAPDPNLKTQVLPNGFTIAVYPNAEPPGRVSMRLLVKRGSACETDDEQGLAHFTEHMAFNGTRRFPSGNMVEYFQRLGMAFGADTNAHTSFTETVYKLDIPEASQKLLDDGAMLLRDYADGILFEPKSIDAERGVIIAEKDSRDTPDYRRYVAEVSHYYKGTVYPKRLPIGDMDVVRGATREKFLGFYNSAYRPENMVLVIVGDVDADKMLELGRKYFSSFKSDSAWKNRIVDFGKVERGGGKFSFAQTQMDLDCASLPIANATSAYAGVAVSRMLPPGPDSFERRVREMRIKALTNAINSRYIKVADAPDSKISSGASGRFDFDNRVETLLFGAEAPIGKYSDALEEDFRQIMSAGNLSDAELENAKKKILNAIDAAIKEKPTRQSRELANKIVSAFSDGEAFTPPEYDAEVAKAAFDGFGAEQAKELLKEFFNGAKVKVFVSDKSCPSGEELDAAAASAFSRAVASKHSSSKFAVGELKFAQFGEAGRVVSRKEIEDLGITCAEFENGVRLNLKKTDFAKDQILMKVSFGDGLLSIPKDKPEYYAALNALIAGGTKFQNAGEIAAAMYVMKMNLNVSMLGNSFYLTGSSGAKDFPSLVRYAATLFAAPGFRDEGLESLRKGAQAFYLACRSDPRAQLGFMSMRITDSNFSKVPGDFENFKKITMSEIEKWLAPALESSYMEISIVGDIDEAQAESLVSQTFGALPPRRATKEGGAFAKVDFRPRGESFEIFYESTNEPLSITGAMWPSCGRGDMGRMRAANVLGEVLDDMLRKEVREGAGKVYSPYAYNDSSTWIEGAGFINALTAVSPEYNAEIGGLILRVGKKLADGLTEDQFERAKVPLVKSVEANLRKNAYWLNAVLNLCQLSPANLEMARTIKSGYDSVTIEEVKALAEEFMKGEPYKYSIMPKGADAGKK